MARYQFVGTEPRHFPQIGLVLHPNVDDEGRPTGEVVAFDSHLPIASPLVLNEDGTPTHEDADGNPIGDPSTNADPDPHRGLAAAAEADEPIAEQTFEDLTKAELYELATDLDLHGRSEMNKPELIAALREAAQVTPEEQAAAEAAIDEAVASVGQTETTEPVAGEGDDTSTEE